MNSPHKLIEKMDEDIRYFDCRQIISDKTIIGVALKHQINEKNTKRLIKLIHSHLFDLLQAVGEEIITPLRENHGLPEGKYYYEEEDRGYDYALDDVSSRLKEIIRRVEK